MRRRNKLEIKVKAVDEPVARPEGGGRDGLLLTFISNGDYNFFTQLNCHTECQSNKVGF